MKYKKDAVPNKKMGCIKRLFKYLGLCYEVIHIFKDLIYCFTFPHFNWPIASLLL